MRKTLSFLLTFLLIAANLTAQTRIVLNQRLAASNPKTLHFNNAKDAFSAIPETGDVEIEVAPGVYWIDNPDDPAVRECKGGIPFAVEIKADRLVINGTDPKAENTVFAVNRGQTQGAIGNYTMMSFRGRKIVASNITFGNFCNVDLTYPADPSKNRKARSKAIVQAQLAICQGTDSVVMNNCRFISRLNLCPFVGAQRAFFSDCHFECTDDALNGAAFYDHCTFDFFSSKPFYSTSATGAVFYDCDITTRVTGVQYLTKAGGPVTMINTRWHSPSDSLIIQWSNSDEPFYVCYASGNTLNGKPIEIDAGRPWRTVRCNDPYHAYLLLQPALTRAYAASGENLQVFTKLLRWGERGDKTEPLYETTYYKENASFRPRHDTIMVERDGLRAIACVHQEGQRYPAPEFLKTPVIRQYGDSLHVVYQLDDDPAPPDPEGNTDHSIITWYKVRDDGKIIPIRQAHAGEVNDISRIAVYGEDAFVSVIPKYLDTQAGQNNECRAYKEVKYKKKPQACYELETDFKDVPLTYASDMSETGVWLMDCFKPSDTDQYDWTADTCHVPWYYGEGVDGAIGKGLVTASRGARLIFTPSDCPSNSLSLDLWADPSKTAGQGFGSATGQFFDIGIGFDAQTLNGYVLRIERTPEYDHAVVFTIRRYVDGRSEAVSESIVSGCFKTGFHLCIELADGKMSVKAGRGADTVCLTADASVCGPSVYMQHTGTCGASALMLHKLRYVAE